MSYLVISPRFNSCWCHRQLLIVGYREDDHPPPTLLTYDTAQSTHLSLRWVGSLFILEMIALWSHGPSSFPGYNEKEHAVSMPGDGLVYLPILPLVHMVLPLFLLLHVLTHTHTTICHSSSSEQFIVILWEIMHWLHLLVGFTQRPNGCLSQTGWVMADMI